MSDQIKEPVHVIGGGLAGSEACWQLASRGVPVVLHEMRPVKKTDAHQTDGLAELVCSNSLRSDDWEFNAVGLLHEEMRKLGSLIIQSADEHKVPAGGALAVDRDAFSDAVSQALKNHDLITIEREEITDVSTLDWSSVIIATGPLTSEPLAQSIRALSDEDSLAFFDAIAPIVYKDSIDFDKAWFQSRYDKGDGSDYINCPLSREQYDAFIEDLLTAEKVDFKQWEKDTPYFEGCLPIEVMAERGPQTLSYGPMKPVGLTNPHDPDNKPTAIVQLRQDNKLGTLYNMVGFQTKMTYGEQKRVFRSIPGLENAEFARLGGLHRNTFINSPRLLNETLQHKNKPNLRFAGQITGCEGYVESAAVGLMVGSFAAAEALGETPRIPPETTALGAILNHITGGADADTYQPMNVNFGLFPPVTARNEKGRKLKGKDRKKAYTTRALNDLEAWMKAPC